MICPRCGWIMRLMNVREHHNYSDELYQCKCGTTHLHIVPVSYSKEEGLFEVSQPLQPVENT